MLSLLSASSFLELYFGFDISYRVCRLCCPAVRTGMLSIKVFLVRASNFIEGPGTFWNLFFQSPLRVRAKVWTNLLQWGSRVVSKDALFRVVGVYSA